MGKNKRTKQNINTEGGAFIGGNVSMGNNSKFVGRDDISEHGTNSDDIRNLFESLNYQIDSHTRLSKQDKIALRGEVNELRQELSKQDKADEPFLLRRLRNIGRMAPDILDVTLATITNPALGYGVIAKKIASKAKEATAQIINN
jgi:hypothetical protein